MNGSGGSVMLCPLPLPHGLHVVAWSHFSYVCLSILPFFFGAFSLLDWWSWVSAWGLVVLLLNVDVDNNFKGP